MDGRDCPMILLKHMGGNLFQEFFCPILMGNGGGVGGLGEFSILSYGRKVFISCITSIFSVPEMLSIFIILFLVPAICFT